MSSQIAPRQNRQASEKEQAPLLPDDAKHQSEWMAAALASDCSRNLDILFKDHINVVKQFKAETFGKVYEALGAEVEGGDLVRVLVVRNEKFGTKTAVLLTVITLGLFCCFRPRDDDTVLVLTKQGQVVQLRVERAACCPPGAAAQFFVFAKYMAILTSTFVLPFLLQCALTRKSVQEELHELHIDRQGLQELPSYANQNRIAIVLTTAVLSFWFCALLPHDYRDRYRRRHMSREVAAGQFVMWGCSCRRRSSMRLFFGKYPSQTVLNLYGSLGNGNCCSPIPPGSLVAKGPSASAMIVGITLLLSLINALNTCFAWWDRSLTLDRTVQMQLFCRQTSSPHQCGQSHCKEWVTAGHHELDLRFCDYVYWESADNAACLEYAHGAPCCRGCTKGAYESVTSEGTLASFKSVVSIVADAGSLLFTFAAAKYALGLVMESDHIDVFIKRRSRNSFQMEVAKFDNTVPVCTDFMEYVFHAARNSHFGDHRSAHNFGSQSTVPLDSDDGSKWCGVHNYELDTISKDWDDFFSKELLVPPDCRWTARAAVPKRCLGIGHDETVLAAWVETPLYPMNMSLQEFLTGGLVYQLLPFGKTRHLIIVTNRRLFYVRYRRPALPLLWLGVDLRVDCFRHDHDVFYAQMDRTKVLFLHRLIHQVLWGECFLPGTIALQNKFGAIQISRAHGDVLDVYHLVCQLSRDTAAFIDRNLLQRHGIPWGLCQENLRNSLRRKSSTLYAIEPQPDDRVEPRPDIQLSHASEQLVFHMSFKDVGSLWSGCYTNTDLVLTTGRLFFWHRSVHKSFDCQACLYWFCCWGGCLKFLFPGKHLPNSCSFLTLPSLLSFSTDLSIDPPSWLEPHHQPLKCSCWETLCLCLTHCCLMAGSGQERGSKGVWRFSCCPRRSAPSAHMKLIWRLKQSAYADAEFLLVHQLKPYVVEEAPESDVEDIYEGLGFAQLEEERNLVVRNNHDDKVETFRKIMCVVQDQCKDLLDRVDSIY